MKCSSCGEYECVMVETKCLGEDGEPMAFSVCRNCDYGINEHTEGECSCATEARPYCLRCRPYCLRCEVPIYQDEEGVWRREATGVPDCPRNPARDGHESRQEAHNA